jgi:MATE family multidrug resistance protein
LGLIFIIFRGYIFGISASLMNIDSSYLDRAQSYFDIRIYTAPAIFIGYVLMGWFFALQNAIYPLIMTFVLNLLNIVLSYYFVYVLNMGIEGAALGTLISQYVSLFLGFVLLFKYKKYFIKLNFKQIIIKSELLRFFRVNSDIFIRTLALTLAFAFLYSQAALRGKDKLAVVVLLLQFVIWFAYSLDGFANAAESLVGKYYGAKDWSNFKRAVRLSIIWSFGLSVVYSIFYYFAGEEILELFTNQKELISKTLSFMPYIVAVPLLSFLAFIWDGIYIGMTATKAMRNTVLISLILYIAGFYLTKDINFILALWINFVLFLFYRGLVQTILFYKMKLG